MAVSVDEHVVKVNLPRRCDVHQMHDSEFELLQLRRTIERMGANPTLTQVTTLLGQASSLLSDYIDVERAKIANPERNADGSMSVTVPVPEGYGRFRVWDYSGGLRAIERKLGGPCTVSPLHDGKVSNYKGGHNEGPSQIKDRPAPPGPSRRV